MSDTRGDGYILTASGVHYYPLDPRSEDVRLEDAAHALSQQCRFGGHTRKKDGSPRHYSVAEHAIYASFVVEAFEFEPLVVLRALHHDSPEYVLVDLPRPIKKDPRMSFYGEAEALNMAAMEGPLGLIPLDAGQQMIIDAADALMLAIEMRDLMNHDAVSTRSPSAPLGPEMIAEARADLMKTSGGIEAQRSKLLVLDMIDIGIERPFLHSMYHWKDAFLARDRAVRAAGTPAALLADRMIKLQPEPVPNTLEGMDKEIAKRMSLGDNGPKRCHCEGRITSCIDCDGNGWIR
jgi:hypothetical protein